MKVVIIDSGISGLNKMQNIKFAGKVILRRDINDNVVFAKCKVIQQHGNFVLKNLAQANVEMDIVDINILNDKLETDYELLIRSLELAEYFMPDVINISLGSPKNMFDIKLKRIVKRLKKKKIVIIAADSNDSSKAIPAMFPEVIGVRESLKCTELSYKDGYFYVPSIKIIRENNKPSNSYAAGYMTGYVIKLLAENRISKSKIQSDLRRILNG